MESLQRQWRKFLEETQKSQQVVGQLSKLFIILHEKVRQTILKCTLNLNFDPTDECHSHLTTVLDLLKRINDPHDVYLAGVSSTIISKFEQQLHDLSDQVQQLLQSYVSAKGINVKQLQRIPRENSKQEFGLKDELKKSQQRRLRSRSGKQSARAAALNQRSTTQRLIEQFSEYKMEFNKKRQKLLKQMDGHIEKRNSQVLFSNKYSGSNLDDYFKMRRQLLDLQIADQYTQKVIREREKPIHIQQEHHKEDLQNKLFTEFKIKTKYMKKQVKENILNALVDVKMKLLEQYHDSNMKKLSEGNPDTLIALVTQRNHHSSTSTLPLHKKGKHASSASTINQLPQNSSLPSSRRLRQSSQSRYPMARKSCKPVVYGHGWSDTIQKEYRQSMSNRLLQGKVPNSIFT